MPKAKKHPSDEMLKQLKDAGWTRKRNGLYWQSPYTDYYFAPAGAVAVEVKKNPTNA